MKTRIAHFGDTHLGYRQYGLSEREDDFYDRFNEIIDHIINNNIDCVIHSGDLFETPKPPIKALLTAQEGFMKLLSHDIPVYVIAGNHDKMQKSGAEIPQKLFENNNFHILEVNKLYSINEEIIIGGIPYLPPQYQNEIKEILEKIKEKCDDYKFKILVLHGGIKDKYDNFSDEFHSETIPEGFDYLAMGHIHERFISNYKNSKICYPGSTELRTKKEIIDYEKQGKGYSIVTFDSKLKQPTVEHVSLPLKREYIIKSIKYVDLDDKLLKIKEEINELEKRPILELTVKEGNFEKSEVLEKINDILGNDILTLRLNTEPTIIDDAQVDYSEETLTPENMLTEKINELYGADKYTTQINDLALSLYKELSIPNKEEAFNIAENFYKKRYGGE